jgi:hypothetical protein
MFYIVLSGRALVAVRFLSCIVEVIINLLTVDMVGLLVSHYGASHYCEKVNVLSVYIFTYLPYSVSMLVYI